MPPSRRPSQRGSRPRNTRPGQRGGAARTRQPEAPVARARVTNRAAIVALVGEVIREKPAAAWLDQLEAAGIPAGPINSISQALHDVQAQHRGMVRMIAGTPLVGSPLRFDGRRSDSDDHPPALGEHTVDVLDALGIGSDEVERLRSGGIVA
jgi:crotonobetainyl-CoA:carnitine CoA-transferase CaiB-like acyl-CoA transferase